MLQSHSLALHRTLVAVDLALLSSAALVARDFAPHPWLAWLLHAQAMPFGATALQIGCLAAAWLFAAARTDVYRSRRTVAFHREMAALAAAGLLTVSVGAMLGHVLHGGLAFAPLGTLALALVFLVSLRAVIRSGLRTLRNRGLNFRRALLVGGGASAKRFLADLQASPHYGIQFVGGLTFGAEPEELPGDIPRLGGIADAEAVLAKHQVDYVLLCCSPKATEAQLQRLLEVCNDAGIVCHYAPPFAAMRNLQPTVAWYGDLPAIALEPRPYAPWQLSLKRAFDAVIATVALVVLAPVMAVIALLVKLQDGGPILFVQERVGRGGRTFPCYKFRTMCPGAEQMHAQLVPANEQDGPAFKMANDPRITPLGRVLRRYSLDELPQLFNVLAGDMSIVGPRPPIPAEVEKYEWWQRRRVSVLPGLTCIWQVVGRPKRVSFRQWMEMDMQYLDNWSLWMDFKLMLRTVGTVLRGRGS
jgi:exopolysaccharide biosynthesis polyprenyl glycosylphosphotransferase